MDNQDPQGKRYLYRANALGFGGQVYRPTPEILPVQAAAVLPISGGHGESRVEKFRHGTIVSFDSAHSRVSGSLGTHKKKNPTFNTSATSTVDKFDLLGMVSAERIVGQISTSHPTDGGEVSIIPLGSHFVDLRVAGARITMESNIGLFCEVDTFSALESKFKNDKAFAEMARREFQWGGGDDAPDRLFDLVGWLKRQGHDAVPELKGFVITSIFKNIKSEDPAVKVNGSVLDVPQFGKVYLGEYVISRQTRRLTMLRVDLGCPFEGEMMAAALEGDGTTFP